MGCKDALPANGVNVVPRRVAVSVLGQQAFDEAFQHLADCRVAWEEDPRDPACIDALGRARVALEAARKAMRAERERLGGVADREPRVADESHVDADQRGSWQGIHPN